jgi:hypothetical protein
MRKYIMFLLVSFAVINSALADINISFNSAENKDIFIGNGSYNTTGNSSISYTLPYDNFDINMISNTSNLNNASLMNNIKGLVNNRYNFIWIAIFIFIFLMAYGYMRQL